MTLSFSSCESITIVKQKNGKKYFPICSLNYYLKLKLVKLLHFILEKRKEAEEARIAAKPLMSQIMKKITT